MDKKLNLMERRVQYDIKQKGDEIIKIMQTAIAAPDVESFLKKPLVNQLPIQTFKDFEIFDIEIKNNDALRENLVNNHIILILIFFKHNFNKWSISF